jgi:carboxyl-terminal processing protease
MDIRKKRFGWIALGSLVVILSLGIVGFNNDNKNFEIVKNLDIFYSVFRELNTIYVDETDPSKLIRTSIDEMLSSLDPYTSFIPESEMEDFKFMTTGEYGGIGSLITRLENNVVIAEPYEGFPAHLAGLKAGDKILEINGQSMAGKSTSDVSALLKGTVNSSVKLKIERPGTSKPLNIELIRKNIQINPVPYYGMVDKETGIIILNNFTQDCAREVENAFVDLKNKQGARKVIIDLRGNPGGLLDEAIKIVNLFVPKGSDIVSTKGKVKQWDKAYTATRQPIDTVMPLAVLISRGSASASEIVAGALQDLDRAIILGQRSFGKGLVQATRNLDFNTKLKVTTAKYYIPSGRCIQALDYTHRNEDGSVGYVPDSLISEYKTRLGRKVYDGGGVSPDIKITEERYSNITYAIVAQQVIFEYATKFCLQNPTIASPTEFKVSDEVFNDFKQFVSTRKDFKYTSRSLEMLKKLKETAEREEYYKTAENEFKSIEEALSLNVDKDMNIASSEIKDLLSLELMRRYYYQKGAIRYSLRDDKTIKEAISSLGDKEQYNGLLNGTVLSHAGDKRFAKEETE